MNDTTRLLVIISLLSALFLLPACNKDKDSLSSSPETAQVPEFQTTIIDAITDFWRTVHSDTKSVSNKEPRILSIDRISVPATKSEKTDWTPYIVNFANDEGFAVVTLENNNSPSVLALTESGVLDKNKLFNQNARFDNDGESIVYRYIEKMLMEEKHEMEMIDKRSTGDSIDGLGGNYVWYTDTIVHPIVHVKWGQEYPFNMHMPVAPNTAPDHGQTSEYRGRYSVGCTIVAAMQIAVATEHPYSFTYNNNQTIDSYMFSSVSFYGNYAQYNPDNYDTSVSDSMKGITDILAQLLYDFGYTAGATYANNGDTGLSSLAAMNYLDYLDHNRYGAFDVVFSTNGTFNTYNSTTIVSMINAGKPLLVQGTGIDYSLNEITHAWVLDGYLKMYRIGLDNDHYTRTYVHFNWGYHGCYDGYFYDATINHRYSIDESYDPDTTPTSWSNFSAHTDIHYFTY